MQSRLRTLRTLALSVACLGIAGVTQSLPVVMPGCAGGVPVSSFRLLVEPPKGGPAIPVTSVNVIRAGDKLRYEPTHLPVSAKHKGKIALMLIPASDQSSKGLKILEPKPAKDVQEWEVPLRTAVLGVVFGPQGLDVKKVSSLVAKNPDLIPQLTAYAEQTGTVEALVQTLSQYEQSPSGTRDLNAALQGFSAQYSIALPKLDTSAPSEQQAALLLRSIMPSLSSYDPLTSGGSAAVMQQSVGLAATLAALFFGTTPVGLAAGGAALVQNMRTLMSPDTDFRSAFVQPTDSNALALCSKAQPARPRTRTAFLWMLRVPDAAAPKVLLPQTANLPIGWKSTVKIASANPAQLKLLPRARDWQLMSSEYSSPVPVKVAVESTQDILSLDLRQAKLPAGKYRLAAKWDWEPFEVEGTAYLHSFSDFAAVKVSPDSQDHLVQGNGVVSVRLTDSDFEFVSKAALLEAKKADADPRDLPFTLPKGKNAGEQSSMETQIDTTATHPGSYRLRLTQLNGATHDIPVTVHPSNPRLEHVPLRVNLGEPQQTVLLQGTGLERIEAITSGSAVWTLAPVSSSARDLSQRKAALKLLPGARKGEQFGIAMSVAGIQQPIQVPDAVQVLGPRAKIVSVNESFPEQTDVSIHQGEIPAGSSVSFAIRTENTDARPTVSLECSNDVDMRQTVSLRPGDRNQMASLDFVGANALFLSLDPGMVGQSGCVLTATVASDSGISDPYTLGRVVRLPRIARFSLTDERAGGALYVGSLTGRDLQMIEKTGWDARTGYPVIGIPMPLPGTSQDQTLKIQLPWPSPAPRSPLYVWLRGETEGRPAKARY